MIVLNQQDFRDKVLACWLGKNIGGTIGAPYEWQRQVNDVSLAQYTAAHQGEPLPNDDLDIQLLWLVAMEERGIDINAQMLADYWCLYVTPHWAEYGIGKTNMRSGLLPPLSGTFNNPYKDSCGAYIRAEIWACIAPAMPALAARYAYEDAILDHGCGEGTYAEVFIAALESAAFVIGDLQQLIAIGLSYIPADCAVARCVRAVVAAVAAGQSWQDTRDLILRDYRGGMPPWMKVSEADRQKGFHTGKLGFDVPSNIGITVLGLLHGGNDFEKMMVTTVNCGEDTDCTGATAGSIFGLIHGTKGIPEAWIKPIGRGIKTICLNLGECAWQIPKNVDDLTDRTVRIARQVVLRHGGAQVEVSPTAPTDLKDLHLGSLRAGDQGRSLYGSLNGPVFRFDTFTVSTDYGDAPLVRSGEPKTIRFNIRNTYKTMANLALRWYLPPGWTVSPSDRGTIFSWQYSTETVAFALRTDRVTEAVTRAVLELTIPGRPTVMLVPITLVNGDVASEQPWGAGPVIT